MAELRIFPIIVSGRNRAAHPDWPPEVPWGLVVPHEARARANHGQSLEQLASRGGLDLVELRAVLEDKCYEELFPAGVRTSDPAVRARVEAEAAAFVRAAADAY